MRTSLNSARLGTNQMPFIDYLRLTARHGFDGVDFSINAAMKYASENTGFVELRNTFAQMNVAPASWGLPVEWRKDQATFENDMATLEECAVFASQLGATRCTTWMPPSVAMDSAGWERQITRRFGEIANVLSDNGIRFGIEWVGPHHLRAGGPNAMGPNPAPHTMEETLRLIHAIGDPTVGLLVDCYHCYTTGVTNEQIAALRDDQIVHVHINDAPLGLSPSDARDGERVLPGTGAIDLAGFLAALRTVGYTGFVATEVLAKEDLASTPDEAAARVKAAMDALGV